MQNVSEVPGKAVQNNMCNIFSVINDNQPKRPLKMLKKKKKKKRLAAFVKLSGGCEQVSD